MESNEHPRDAMARQICESIDRLDKEVDKVEFWACAVVGFTKPIPDDDHPAEGSNRYFWSDRTPAGIVVNITRADRHRLEAIVSDRSAPQKHVWRANIILATADGCGTAEIMRRSGKSKPVVWRWQARFMAEGVEGLTRDKARKPGKQPRLPASAVQRVIDDLVGSEPHIPLTASWTQWARATPL
jgi:hypothetical protein